MIIASDPVAKTQTLMHHDGEGITIENTQDVTEILEWNKANFNSHGKKARCATDGELVASIPLGIFFDLVSKGIAYDEKAFRKWLDDSDNQVFRQHPTGLSYRRLTK